MAAVVPTTLASPAAAGGSTTTTDTHKDSKWFMTQEQVQNSPSRRDGIPADQELNLRQKAAYLIQDMGQRLRVSQLCINTAIVYMHRFYMYHSFNQFHRTGIAAASLFLAAKVEEQPRKVESIIQMLFASQSLKFPEVGSPTFQEHAQDLVFNENVLLQTLGFDVAVDHPHTHVVKTCHLVKACKDLAQTSYFLASNSLHLTTMCLQYRPTVVACFCIYLACKWSRWEIPQSTEGKYWFHYVDRTVTMEILEQLTNEFLVIYDNSPSRLKKQLNNCKGLGLNSKSPAQPSAPTQMPRHHSQSSSSSSSQQQQQSQQPAQQQSQSSSHQRSTVHHHAGKLPPPGMASGNDHQRQQSLSSSAQMAGKPSSAQPPSSSVSGASSRHPSQHPVQRSDHRPSSAHTEPQFSAPHRPGTSGSAPPPSTSSSLSSAHQQPVAYGLHSGGSSGGSSSSKSRHMQQQQQQQQYQQLSAHQQIPAGSGSGSDSRHLMQQQQQQQHQKQRSSKDPPPKYMDSKMPAPLSTGLIAGSSSSSASSAVNSSAGKKSHYPMQQMPLQQQPQLQQQQHPPQSHGGGPSLGNKYDMSKQPPPPQSSSTLAQSQSHLASKSSNYPTQPPNYNQSIANRNDHHSGGIGHHNQQSQSTSVHPHHHNSQQPQQQQQHHQQQQQHQQHHQQQQQNHPQTNNTYGLSDGTTSSYNRPPAASQSASAADDLMAIMMDGMDSKSKVPSIFSPDYAAAAAAAGASSGQSGGPPTPKKDKIKRESQSAAHPNSGYKMHSFGPGGGVASDGKQRNPSQLSSSASVPPTNAYGMPKPHHQQQQQQQMRPVKQETGAVGGVPKRTHQDDFGQRQHDGIGNDYHRDSKFRKLDSNVGGDTSNHSAYGHHASLTSGYGSVPTTMAGGVSSLLKGNNSFNGAGIETNPDLVSSLLKESLCDTKYTGSNLLGTSSSNSVGVASSYDTSMMSLDSMLDSRPPLNLLASDMLSVSTSSMQQQPQQPMLSQQPNVQSMGLIAADVTATSVGASAAANLSANDSSDHEHKYKSEKKKKKEKSKHKEKGKDREERKKHKKDKDRHRERSDSDQHHHHRAANGPSTAAGSETTTDAMQNPIKIKIPKDKLNMSAGEASSGFKITIPKDRLSGGSGGGAADASGGSAAAPSASSLKIKISKDVLENYNSHGGGGVGGAGGGYDGATGSNHHSGSGHGSSSSGGGGGGSGKKRDRDHHRSSGGGGASSSSHHHGQAAAASGASKASTAQRYAH